MALTFVVLYPLFTRLAASFMEPQDVHDLSVRYIPRNPTLDNYTSVWKQLDLTKVFPVTLLFSGAVSALQMLSATIVGYGLARFKIRLRGVFFVLALLSLMIPPDLLLIPLFGEFRYVDVFGLVSLINGGQPLSLINTPWPFIILAVTCSGYRCGLYILILCQFFRGVPKELEEAACIDGCGPLKTFLRVMVPNVVPALLTITVFSVVWYYNDYTLSSMLLNDNFPLSVTLTGVSTSLNNKLQNMAGQVNGADVKLLSDSILSAACLIVVLPLIGMYVVVQRFFTEGVERTGIVG